MNLTNARFKRDFAGVDEEFGGYVSENYARAYLHHLLKAKEFLAGTLCTIHNERFVIRMVDQIRAAITAGEFDELREHGAWVRTHVAPWVQRRVTGRSSGDGRTPKRPTLTPVQPAPLP